MYADRHTAAGGICIGGGTKSDPYLISTAQELADLAAAVNSGTNYSGKYIKLTEDIDLSMVCGPTVGEGGTAVSWTPIGGAKDFQGEFDGQGHTISGLYINNPSEAYQGLFGYIKTAEIKNLAVVGTVSGRRNVGGVVGYSLYGTVTNCSFDGTVSGSDIGFGGVVGYSLYGTVTNCSFDGTVSGSDIGFGGVVGVNVAGTINNCFNIGTVSGSGTGVGGVVGENNNNGTVSNCYYLDTAAKGGMNGIDAAGRAEAKTEAQFASGEVAYLLQGEQTEHIWGQTIGQDKFPKIFGTVVYAKYISCSTIGYTNNKDDVSGPITHSFSSDGFCTECGAIEPAIMDTDGLYQISNIGQLMSFADLVNSGKEKGAKGKLMNDIDLSAICGEGKDNRITIGNSNYSFLGTFDGQGHTISGLYINDPSEDYQGLFRYVNTGAEIKNLAVVGTVSGKSLVGGVVGLNYDGTVTNCSFDGMVTGTDNVGGVVGCNNLGTVSNCFNTGTVTGSGTGVGGVVGLNYDKLSNCFNIGKVAGSGTGVGGVVGENDNNGTVSNCYYLKDTAAGGIKGEDAISRAEVRTEEQFASGEVAWLLNGSKADGVWKQTLSKDAYPSFTGPVVYYDANATQKYYNIKPTCTNTVLKKITALETQDKSTATAVLSQINMNGDAIRSITWTYTAADNSEYTAKYTQQISGESTVYFGIVVPALLEAQENQTTDEIAVNID